MTSLEVPAPRPARPARPDPPIRIRIPASRGGLAWLAVLLVIGAFLAVQVGREVYQAWSIDQDANAIRAQIAEMEAHNAVLREELNFVQSDAFVAAEARRLLNLGLVGEQVLIIPEGAQAPMPQQAAEQAPPARPLLQQWLELFFGR
jgi:cell division protein FtsB